MFNCYRKPCKVFFSNFLLFILGFYLPRYEVCHASDYHSPRTDALGGAGHAGPLLCDAIYLNPSYASLAENHAISVNYQLYNGESADPNNPSNGIYGHLFNVGILDGSSDALFQAGVGFTRREDTNFVHIGASKAIIQKLGVGLGTKIIFPNDSSGTRIFDGTFSVSGILSSWLVTTFVVDNVFENAVSRGFVREYTLGTRFSIQNMLSIFADPNWTQQGSWGFELGVEIPVLTDFYLRLGKFMNSMVVYEARRGDGYGIGAGWLAPKLSLDYSYTKIMSPIGAYSHNFGATIYF